MSIHCVLPKDLKAEFQNTFYVKRYLYYVSGPVEKDLGHAQNEPYYFACLRLDRGL